MRSILESLLVLLVAVVMMSLFITGFIYLVEAGQRFGESTDPQPCGSPFVGCGDPYLPDRPMGE